ncbi:VOC family protein [Nocardioides sp. LHG3406-4]|uniref:VOC family protein n=1 Tax=Nocardioides sp. LHG3406-4 TaxID=2804575 RepID=UPI003CF09318
MARFDSYLQGTPSWIEHSSPDPEASKQFYGDLFGWDYDDQPMMDGDTQVGAYAIARIQGDPVAGLGSQFGDAQGQPASWGVYLAADDVDAAVDRARDAGAQVLAEPTDVGEDQGRIAWVQDPVGAAVGLWQAGSFAGALRANEHGTNVWNELVTADVGRATPFYDKVLGITAEEMPMGDGGDPYTTLNVQGRSVAGVTPPQDEGVPPHWNVCFNVDDADRIAARATELGAKQVVAPFDVPGIGRIAGLTDPQGAMFSVMQNPPEAG